MSNKPHSNEEFAIEEKESKILEKEAYVLLIYLKIIKVILK